MSDGPAGPAPEAAPAARTMYSPLAALVASQPATLPLEATVRQALETMERRHVDSIVVADARRVPLGIFTLRDLLRRVTLPGGDLEQPVACVMTSGLVTLRPQATAHQAALTMARHRVGQIVVVDDAGRLAGVVSQGDLFALHQLGAEQVSDEIQAARDLEGLLGAAQSVRRLTVALLYQGVAAEPLTHFISTLNDLLTARILEITADEHELPPVPICWIAAGSEGRLEQTFSTDQDNGLVFEAPRADAARVRAGLLPFARAVNERLAACGFALCKGQVMAGNPAWCLSVEEWQSRFSSWLEEPVPEALLDASIFFDLRPVWGHEALAERLRAGVLAGAPGRPVFLRLLAADALIRRPPLGRIRPFTFRSRREFGRTLDLKTSGSRIFADAARVYALGHGVAHTSTTERLRALAGPLHFADEELRTMVDAFFFLHLLRLRIQSGPARAAGWENRADPRRLGRQDRYLLLEAFRQAAWLQRRLAADFLL